MKAVVIRKLPEATHRALQKRAEQHGRSTEAEIRAILEEAVNSQVETGIGSRLAELGKRIGGVDIVIERSREPAVPVSFE